MMFLRGSGSPCREQCFLDDGIAGDRKYAIDWRVSSIQEETEKNFEVHFGLAEDGGVWNCLEE
jgi:hypothetical protein